MGRGVIEIDVEVIVAVLAGKILVLDVPDMKGIAFAKKDDRTISVLVEDDSLPEPSETEAYTVLRCISRHDLEES